MADANDYDVPESAGVPKGDGESWGDLAKRRRKDADRIRRQTPDLPPEGSILVVGSTGGNTVRVGDHNGRNLIDVARDADRYFEDADGDVVELIGDLRGLAVFRYREGPTAGSIQEGTGDDTVSTFALDAVPWPVFDAHFDRADW